LVIKAAILRKLILRNRNSLKLPVNVDVEAVKYAAVLDVGNCGAVELFSVERIISGYKFILFLFGWLNDGGDNSEKFLKDVVVWFE